MSFGQNLQYLRKQANMTQEDLAEQMGVSRQTVSKWESDGAFPEMEKLIALCDLYQIDMNTILRGNAEQQRAADVQDYDGHMNRFTWQMMSGVGLILLGVTLMLALLFLRLPEGLAFIVFFLFLIAAVSILVIAGIHHDNFQKENPHVAFTYDPEIVRTFRKKLPILIVVPIAMILAGVMVLIALNTLPMPFGTSFIEGISLVFLMLMVTAAVPIFIYAGIQSDKYNIENYNAVHNPDDNDPSHKKLRKADAISSCIMLAATAAFLLLGFLGNMWHPGWVVFPIGGIACGIVETILGVKA